MYQVRICDGVPTVVDVDGVPVPNGHVRRVSFPNKEIETASGKTHVIEGPGKAEIIVDGTDYSDIPLV